MSAYIQRNYERKGCTDQDNVPIKIKIKCFSLWDINAGPSLVIRLPFRCQGHADSLYIH